MSLRLALVSLIFVVFAPAVAEAKPPTGFFTERVPLRRCDSMPVTASCRAAEKADYAAYDAGTRKGFPHVTTFAHGKVNCNHDGVCDAGWHFAVAVFAAPAKDLELTVGGVKIDAGPYGRHLMPTGTLGISVIITDAKIKAGKQAVVVSHKGKPVFEGEIELAP